jgi:hypothetical protein
MTYRSLKRRCLGVLALAFLFLGVAKTAQAEFAPGSVPFQRLQQAYMGEYRLSSPAIRILPDRAYAELVIVSERLKKKFDALAQGKGREDRKELRMEFGSEQDAVIQRLVVKYIGVNGMRHLERNSICDWNFL